MSSPDSQPPLSEEQLRQRREEAARRQALQMRQQTQRIMQNRISVTRDGVNAAPGTPAAPPSTGWRKVSEVHTTSTPPPARSTVPGRAPVSTTPAARSNASVEPVGRSTVKAVPVSRARVSPAPPAQSAPVQTGSVPLPVKSDPPVVAPPVAAPAAAEPPLPSGPPPKPIVLKMKVQEVPLPEQSAPQLPPQPGARVTNSISQMADNVGGPTTFAPLIAGVTAPTPVPVRAPTTRVEEPMPSLRTPDDASPSVAEQLPELRLAGAANVPPVAEEMPELHMATDVAPPLPPDDVSTVLRLANQPPPMPGAEMELPPPLPPMLPTYEDAPPHMMQTPPPLPADLPPIDRPPPHPQPPDDADLAAPELHCPNCEVLIPESHRGTYFTACPKCGEIFKMR